MSPTYTETHAGSVASRLELLESGRITHRLAMMFTILHGLVELPPPPPPGQIPNASLYKICPEKAEFIFLSSQTGQHLGPLASLYADSFIVLPAKSYKYVMFCLQRYHGLRIDRSLVY